MLVALVLHMIIAIECMIDVCELIYVKCISSKNSVLIFLIFPCRIGFKICSVLVDVGGLCRASSVLGGMFRVTGEWSKFRLWSLFVMDLYRSLLLGALI